MKIKCDDGKVRDFRLANADSLRPFDYEGHEAMCKQCGKHFGCSDTRLLKPKFKKHSCKLPLCSRCGCSDDVRFELDSYICLECGVCWKQSI